MIIGIQGLIVAMAVTVHLLAGQLQTLHATQRSQWLSLAGGVAVAYIFVHVFPQLAAAQTRITDHPLLTFLEHHIYVVALSGLAVFYGLERMVKTSRRQRDNVFGQHNDFGEDTGRENGRDNSRNGDMEVERHIFWLHIVIFAIYNAVIGYLLVHREGQEIGRMLVYGGMMALHFLVNDYALEQHHLESYQRSGRWLLAAAISVGWLIGLATQVNVVIADLLFAFLAGGIVLNVLKEELPEERRSRFIPFIAGAAVYTVLLMFI